MGMNFVTCGKTCWQVDKDRGRSRNCQSGGHGKYTIRCLGDIFALRQQSEPKICLNTVASIYTVNEFAL